MCDSTASQCVSFTMIVVMSHTNFSRNRHKSVLHGKRTVNVRWSLLFPEIKIRVNSLYFHVTTTQEDIWLTSSEPGWLRAVVQVHSCMPASHLSTHLLWLVAFALVVLYRSCCTHQCLLELFWSVSTGWSHPNWRFELLEFKFSRIQTDKDFVSNHKPEIFFWMLPTETNKSTAARMNLFI